jgi:hypothetical protein
MTIEQNTFDSASVSLDQENFGKIPESQFDTAMASKMQEDIADSLTPEDIKPSDANKVDVQLQGNIAVNLRKKDLFTGDLSTFEDPDAESASDKIDAVFKSSSPFTTDPTRLDLSGRNTGPDAVLKPVGISGKTAEEELAEAAERDPDTPPPIGELDFNLLADPAKRYAIKGYESIRDFFTNPPPEIQTTGAYDISQGGYRQPYSTGYLGTYPTQSSIGLSSAPPASLAGQGNVSMMPFATGTAAGLANLGVRAGTQTGLGTFSTLGASGNVPFPTGLGTDVTKTAAGSSAMKVFGTAASIYGIYDGIKNKDYFSAGTSLITLLNPATAVPMAILQGAKMLFGAWSASKRAKPKFGGAEFKAEKNRLMATDGWGYNGYQPSAGKATVASIADYVNTYVKTFGLQFNGTRWAKAVEADPRLNRFDSTNESGHNDPSVLSRKIFETQGLITGNPTYNGQPITSQEDYKAKMEQFNEYYKKTALERGGLVDAQAVGIDPNTLSNEYDTITFKESTQVGGGGTGKQYTTINTDSRHGGGTTQTGYWQDTGTGGRGGGNRVWVPAKPNVVVDQGYYGTTAHAISYRYEDATPYDMLYRNLVGRFQRGQGGTYY